MTDTATDWLLNASCQVCGCSEEVLLCSGCDAAYYCSIACQRSDRSRHRKQDGCARMKKKTKSASKLLAKIIGGRTIEHTSNFPTEDDTKDASIREVAREWKPTGASTFFPRNEHLVTNKTPMGMPLDLCPGLPLDRSFGSKLMMVNDRVEMFNWLSTRIYRFDSALGLEIERTLLSADFVLKLKESLARGDVPSMDSLIPATPAASSAVCHRPTIVYIAGVEGTGHHGIMPMLMYAAIKKFGKGVFAWWRSLREVFFKTHPRERKSKLRLLMEAMHINSSPQIIFESASWPFGEESRERWAAVSKDRHALLREEQSGNPGNSIDLQEFVELFQDYGDVRVLFLYRDLVAAAWSHKEWDDGLFEHAEVLSLFQEYLTRIAKTLQLHQWRWVAYEDLCSAHVQRNFAAIEPIADFLGLPRNSLKSAFESFQPSKKQAAKEMSTNSRIAISDLESECREKWFPHIFPAQQLMAPQNHGSPPGSPSGILKAQANRQGQPERLAAQLLTEREKFSKSRCDLFKHQELDTTSNPKLALFMQSLDSSQHQEFRELLGRDSNRDGNDMKLFHEMLSEDQKFLLSKAMLKECVNQETLKCDIDVTNCTCVHMWIEDRGFGSEINGLISAAIFCQHHGLHCVVEDAEWNCGRLHDYLQTEPLIKQRCPNNGHCVSLDVRRDKREATPGWFAICKHSMDVPFDVKAVCAQRIWNYTPATRTIIQEMNRELNLPSHYMAVQIRRGDKVFRPCGARGNEALPVDIFEYARVALLHFKSPCTAIVVSTDDASAAVEFAAEVQSLRSDIQVRYRSRQAVPVQLLNGHWQKEWNALPLDDRVALTHEFLADVELMRGSHVLVCTHSSNVARLVAVLRDGSTVSLDEPWTNS